MEYSECDLGCQNVSTFFSATKDTRIEGKTVREWTVHLCKVCVVRIAGKKFADKNHRVRV